MHGRETTHCQDDDDDDTERDEVIAVYTLIAVYIYTLLHRKIVLCVLDRESSMTTNMHMMTRLQKRLREEEEQEAIVYADAMREMLQRASIDVKLQILRHVMHDGSNSNEKKFLCLKLLGLMDDSVFAFEESVLRSVFDLAFCVRYGVCRLYLNFIRKSGHTGVFADFEICLLYTSPSPRD